MRIKTKNIAKIRDFIDEWFIFIGYVGLSNQVRKSKNRDKLYTNDIF